MSKNILLIDDSATIRRLVDTELSAAGFNVILAANAEDGIALAASETPDLIILDHQLPGTTGYEVCCQLLEDPSTAKLPIVASSTLRKKAYSEYVDCDNVVDMLPKPYTPEVLVATVENAIDTAAMVVQSQSAGSAVPEVINELGEASLAGTFDCFSLREVIDMLTNGSKAGALEITTETFRVYVFTENGRIQAVTGSGIESAIVASQLPESMAELAPVVKFTVAGKKGSEIDGLVELLNNKVLDPRLLKNLLRMQAAILLRLCFKSNVQKFRFENNQAPPQLFSKLKLESSLVALLVEAASFVDSQELPSVKADQGVVRKTIRGQSVDRAGLSSKHVQLMKLISERKSLDSLATDLGWSLDETLRVIAGFKMADLLDFVSLKDKFLVYAVSPNAELKSEFQSTATEIKESASLKCVSDCLALGLLLRRQTPDLVLIDVSDQNALAKFTKLAKQEAEKLANTKKVAGCFGEDAFDKKALKNAGFDSAVNDVSQFSALLSKCQSVSDPVSAAPVTNEKNVPASIGVLS